MEAFESFVAVALEAEGLVVSGSVKFAVTRRTRKAQQVEVQTHGFEVDLVAANAERLVLTTVKSFFGSRGVVAEHVTGASGDAKARLYALLNDEDVRRQGSVPPARGTAMNLSKSRCAYTSADSPRRPKVRTSGVSAIGHQAWRSVAGP